MLDKQRNQEGRQPGWRSAGESHREPPVSLAMLGKIRIKRAIRGSRPGAERTVSAISPDQAMLMWQGQLARRPVFPPSEAIPRVLSEGLEGLDAGAPR